MLTHHVDKIIDFIQHHLKYKDRDLIKKYLAEHIAYGTFDYAIDSSGEIVAICRWNLSDDALVCFVLDFAIRSDFRNSGIGRDFVLRALKKFPNIKFLEFQRGLRGCDRPRRVNIKAILKRNMF